MFHHTIVMGICVLATVSSAYQEMTLIVALNGFFTFDHNLFFVDTAVDIDPLLNGAEFTPRSILQMDKDFDEDIIESKNTFVIFAIANSKFNDTLRMRDRIEKVRYHKTKFGIFFPESASTEDLQQLFEWCKENLIVDIFATILFESLNIFTFNPFGPFTMVNLTSSTSDKFFANRKTNYTRLSVEPFGFGGAYTASILWPTSFDIEELYMEFRRDHTDLQADQFEDGINVIPAVSDDCDFRVYPLAMLQQVIVVPQSLPYADFTAYLLTFVSDQLFGYSLITVAVLMLLLTMFRYIKQTKILFFQSVADVLNLLINDNEYIRYQRLSLSECYVIVPLTFVGLVFVNGILSNLQSYITRPVYEPQMNSIEDIYRSRIPILTWGFGEWRTNIVSRLQAQTEFPDWNDTIVEIDQYNLAEDIAGYKRIAFITSSSTANLLIETQKRLNIRGYHNTLITVQNLFFWYPLDDRFVFWERLTEIVLTIQSAGLYDQWERQHFTGFEMKIVKENNERLSTQNEGVSAGNSLDFPIFIVYGWIAGAIVFLLEIIWKRVCDLDILSRNLFGRGRRHLVKKSGLSTSSLC